MAAGAVQAEKVMRPKCVLVLGAGGRNLNEPKMSRLTVGDGVYAGRLFWQ